MEKKTKHTPAPWVVMKDSEEPNSCIEVQKDGDSICLIARQNKGNALLISAAPDMYDEINQSIQDLIGLQKALQKTFENKSFGINSHIQCWIDRKELLIKKATGDE